MRHHYRHILQWIICWLLCGLCLRARANTPEAQHSSQVHPQSAAADDCLSDAKCVEIYESARRLSQAGQYEAALVTYQSAYARKPVAWLLVNIGRIQQKMGRPQPAIVSFKRLLATPSAQGDEELLKKTREYLRQAEQDVAAQERSLEPAPLPLLGPKPAAPQPAPVYKKWWLWTAIGGATAALAIGIGAGLVSRAPVAPSVPQGVSIYETGL